MNARSLFLPWLLVSGFCQLHPASGKTYPNGTVSPFDPGFHAVGQASGGTESHVFSVSAHDGVFAAAVGTVKAGGNNSLPSPALFLPTGAIEILSTDGGVGGVALAISDDGKIKVGNIGAACYWDAQNQVHLLPFGAGVAADTATAVSADGSKIVGSVQFEDSNEAVVWLTGHTDLTRLGLLASYDASIATGISPDGKFVCGQLSGTDPQTQTARSTAFRVEIGQPMQALPKISQVETPYDISSDGGTVVGVSSLGACRWTVFNSGTVDRAMFVNYGSGAGQEAAFAVNTSARAPSGYQGRVVGQGVFPGVGDVAVMWNLSLSSTTEKEGSIKALLVNTYKVPMGNFDLTIAYALSNDGYTVGGEGRNATGQTEGWIAALPPIFFPAIVKDPGPQQANVLEVFQLQMEVANPDRLLGVATIWSAKGLPKDFRIDATTGVIDGLWLGGKAASYSVTVIATNTEGSGSATFTLTLPPPSSTTKKIDGHGFLQLNKPPNETQFPSSSASGLAANGATAVGQDSGEGSPRAYRRTATGGISGLPMLPGALRSYSSAIAVSADGLTVVGQAAEPPLENGFSPATAVVWKPAAAGARAAGETQRTYAINESAPEFDVIDLGLFPGGIISLATAVSSDGSVVVGYGDAKDPDPNYRFQVYEAFRWTAQSGRVGLGFLPGGLKLSQAFGVSADGSTIVGVADSAIGNQAFRWTAMEGMVGLGKLPGSTYTRASAISADKAVIIGHAIVNGDNRAFRWTAAAGIVDLGLLPGATFCQASALSSDGSIIVGSCSNHAFIWDQANGMRDLQSVLVAGNPELASWTVRSAVAITGDGKTIAGTALNPNGDFEGFTAYLEVKPSIVANISTRAVVGTGDDVLIGGFILTGTESKKVIVRAIGPSLPLAGKLADPQLELYNGAREVIASNDNWRSNQEAEIIASTIPPTHELESAIVMTLPANSSAYTAIVRGINGTTGHGLMEIYDLDPQSDSKLANISSRSVVQTGDNVMIAGFIISGPTSRKVIVRAIGPSLPVAGKMSDTTLELYNSDGVSLGTNDDWRTGGQEAEIIATTIPPKNDLESAMVRTIGPAAYTAIVRGKNSATGVALVEVYTLD